MFGESIPTDPQGAEWVIALLIGAAAVEGLAYLLEAIELITSMTLGVLYVSIRSMNSPSQIVGPDKDSYLAKVFGRVKTITKSPAAKYASSGAGAGAVVGTLLLGPLGAAIGGAVGGGIGGYLGARRAERVAQEAAEERLI